MESYLIRWRDFIVQLNHQVWLGYFWVFLNILPLLIPGMTLLADLFLGYRYTLLPTDWFSLFSSNGVICNSDFVTKATQDYPGLRHDVSELGLLLVWAHTQRALHKNSIGFGYLFVFKVV